MLKKRGIILGIILTFVTLGIYGIVWMICLSNELSDYNDEKKNGLVEFLLMLVTFGIYYIYWNYKMGKKVLRAEEKAGKKGKDNSVIYAILSFLGAGLISLALVQSRVNKIIN